MSPTRLGIFAFLIVFQAWSLIFLGLDTLPQEQLSQPWVGGGTDAFARRWENHKVRNALVYSCIGTRHFPILGSLVRFILSCPEVFYDARYDDLFGVPKLCLAHSCLQHYGKSHFVYATFVVKTYDNVVSRTIRPAKATAEGKIAVLVEPRLHSLLEYTVKQVMLTLGPDWALQLFVSDENEAYVRERFLVHSAGEGEHIVISNLNEFGLGNMAYAGNRIQSGFSAHEQTYNAIKAEYILWFQLDVVLRSSPKHEWLQYTYVGSEWHGCEFPCDAHQCKHVCSGGNSGLSLRRRSKMQQVATRGSLPYELWGVPSLGRPPTDIASGIFDDDDLRNNSETRWFEDDLQISCKLQTLHLLPPGNILPRFAVGETLPTEGLEMVQPSGIHKSWMSPHFQPSHVIKLLDVAYAKITTIPKK